MRLVNCSGETRGLFFARLSCHRSTFQLKLDIRISFHFFSAAVSSTVTLFPLLFILLAKEGGALMVFQAEAHVAILQPEVDLLVLSKSN